MAKKAKRAKLPKRIAGVKLAKNLRRGPLADFVASPFGQNLLAETIYHAGAAVVDRAEDSRAARGAGRAARRAGRDVSDLSGNAASAVAGGTSMLVHAFTAAAHTFVDTLRHKQSEAKAVSDEDKPLVVEEPSPRAKTDLETPNRGWSH